MITAEMTAQEYGGEEVKGTADGPEAGVGQLAPFYFYIGALFLGSQSQFEACCRGPFKSPGVNLQADLRMSVALSLSQYTASTTPLPSATRLQFPAIYTTILQQPYRACH